MGLDNSEEEIDTESDSGSENDEDFDGAQGTEQTVSVVNNSVKAISVTNDSVKPVSISVLKFTKEGEKKTKLRRPYGTASERTIRRRNKDKKDLRGTAQASYSLKSMFQRQIDKELSSSEDSGGEIEESKEIEKDGDGETGRYYSIGHKEILKQARQDAAIDLNNLLWLKTEQKKKYGFILSSKPNLLRRHLLVQAFFNLQALKLEKPEKFHKKRCPDVAIMVANTYGARGGTTRSIVNWENTWVKQRLIPETLAGKHKHKFSWMDDEELIFKAQEYIKAQGDSEYWLDLMRNTS